MGAKEMTLSEFRDAVQSLLTSRYTRSLESRIAELKDERDYFKGRMERIEQMRYAPVVAPAQVSVGPVVGRKTMAQLQQELADKEQAASRAQEKN